MGSYGPPPKVFVYFRKRPRPPRQKTDRWEMRGHDGSYLGIVRYYPGWRCFVTDDTGGSIISHECHAEMAKFCKARTDELREAWRGK